MSSTEKSAVYFALPEGGEAGLIISRFDERQRRSDCNWPRPRTAGCALLIDLDYRELGFDVPRSTGETAKQWPGHWQPTDVQPAVQKKCTKFAACRRDYNAVGFAAALGDCRKRDSLSTIAGIPAMVPRTSTRKKSSNF